MRVSTAAVLFDNDGVLVDSHEQVVACWTTVAREFGLDIDVLLEQLVGVRAADTLGRHLPAQQVVEAAARLEQLEVDHAEQTQPLRGAVDLVNRLHDAAWTIVTSGSRRLAEARWNGAGILIPDRTVTADDVTKGKPDPEPFLVGASLLETSPGNCLAFEDSASGGAAARAAGMTVIAVGRQPWPFEPLARIDDLAAVHVQSTAPTIQLEVTPLTP